MAVIKTTREGSVWDPGPNFYKGKDAIKKAADYFGLDLSLRGDREELLLILAEVLFGADTSGRPRGAKGWTNEKLIRLGRMDREIKQKNPKLKDRKISELIGKQAHRGFPAADAIRKQLPAARQALLSEERRAKTPPSVATAEEWQRRLAKYLGK
jgi:hypothetical protein